MRRKGAQIITAAIIKGGAGKTSTIAALAQAASFRGCKVLCIDLDPQGNLTAMLGGDPGKPGSYDLLTGKAATDCMQDTEQGIQLIGSSKSLATIGTATGSAYRLRDALEPIQKDFSYIFIDTPPQIGELVFNALQAATGLIVPMETDPASIQGLSNIVALMQAVQKNNKGISLIGIVLTRYDGRPKLSRLLRDKIKEGATAANIRYLGEIRQSVSIREAQAMRESLYSYAPNSKPAKDYMQIMEGINNGTEETRR